MTTGTIIIITNWSKIRADVIFGTTQITNNFNEECQCDDCHRSIHCDQICDNNNYGCEYQDGLLKLSDCSEGYANHSSQILVHPLQLPGIVLDIHFKPCSHMCDVYDGCYTNGADDGYNAVCIKTNSSACVTYFNNQCTAERYSISEFDPQKICGSCADQAYGIAINSPNFICAECKPIGIAVFIFLQLFPSLIMMIVLAVLHINITNGNLNGFVLYSQMVTLQFPVLGYTGWVPTGHLPFNIFFYSNFLGVPLIVYSIWNLNFLNLYLIPFCLPYVQTAAEAILLQYVTAAFPLLFIVVSYSWIHCYNNGHRFVVTTTSWTRS